MGEIPKPDSENLIKGHLVEHAARMATTAALRESFLQGRRPSSVSEAPPIAEATSPIPEDYDLPKSAQEAIRNREISPNHTPFSDPEGVLFPGLILTNPTVATHRRMVTNVFSNRRGLPTVAVHIEGQDGVRNMPLHEVRTRIAEGGLQLPEPPRK